MLPTKGNNFQGIVGEILMIISWLVVFQVMGGQGSDMFEYFKILILQGLVAARKHSDKITTVVDVMRAGKKEELLFYEIT